MNMATAQFAYTSPEKSEKNTASLGAKVLAPDFGAPTTTRLTLIDGILFVATVVHLSSDEPETCERDADICSSDAAAVSCESHAAWESEPSTVENTPKHALDIGILNEGSVGHPLFCHRACHYFPRGECTRGATCGFCHRDHTQCPHGNLSQRSKEILMRMEATPREALLASVAWDKVGKIQMGSRGHDLVQEWCDRVGTPSPLQACKRVELEGVEPHLMKSMIRELRKMNVHVLLGVARYACAGSRLLEATENLLGLLRRVCGS